MGEIFQYPIPPAPLAFTGERLTSDYGGQTQIEHLHRYMLAREWCRGKDVLDVASGEGYGTALLAQVARSALGVELAADAVAHAAAAYITENLRFAVGDARVLPNPDQSFDVVVSFETIEHFAEHDKFLMEIKRVLRPGGLLIVSTPDRDNYSPAETPANPYHVKEMSGAEFNALLQSHFPYVSILLQRPMFGSVLLPANASATPSFCFERRGAHHFEGSSGLARPQYLLAFASEGRVADLPSSVYIDTGRLGMIRPADAEDRYRSLQNALQSERERVVTTALQSEHEVKQLHGEVKGLVAANEMAERACAAMKTELAVRVQENAAMKTELAVRVQENAAMKTELAVRIQENAAMKTELAVRAPATLEQTSVRTPDFLRRFERSIRLAIRSRSKRL
jgi:SAM-dependent methyltransferase